MPPVAELKDRLRQLLSKKRCTHKEIALECGVSTQAVSGWLAGTQPKPKHLASLAAYLGVTTDYLVSGDGTLGRKLQIEALMAELPTLDDDDIKLLVMTAQRLNRRRT